MFSLWDAGRVLCRPSGGAAGEPAAALDEVAARGPGGHAKPQGEARLLSAAKAVLEAKPPGMAENVRKKWQGIVETLLRERGEPAVRGETGPQPHK
jgi:hypothetical protein